MVESVDLPLINPTIVCYRIRNRMFTSHHFLNARRFQLKMIFFFLENYNDILMLEEIVTTQMQTFKELNIFLNEFWNI